MSDDYARSLQLIDHYMLTRKRPARVSAAKTARAVLAWMSPCSLSVAGLEDAIAEAAEKHGHAFDRDLRDLP